LIVRSPLPLLLKKSDHGSEAGKKWALFAFFSTVVGFFFFCFQIRPVSTVMMNVAQ